VAHRPAYTKICGAAGDGVTGALEVDRERLFEALLYEIRQFEILEKHVEELFLGQGELKCILAGAVWAALRPAAAFATIRPGDLISPKILFIAGDHVLGATGAPAVVKDGLGDPAGRDRYFLALADICDLALAQSLLNSRFDLRPSASEETLAIAQALAL